MSATPDQNEPPTPEQHRDRVLERMTLLEKTFAEQIAAYGSVPPEEGHGSFVDEEKQRQINEWETQNKAATEEISRSLEELERKKKAMEEKGVLDEELYNQVKEEIAAWNKSRAYLVPRPTDAALTQLAEEIWLTTGKPFTGVKLNYAITRAVVEQYFQDSDVYKKFHGIEKTDDIKKGAILAKWICRLRPAVIELDGAEITQQHLLFNEFLAFLAICNYLGIDPLNIPDPLQEEFIYTLRNHSPDEHSLIPIVRGLYATHLLAEARKEIEILKKQIPPKT